MCGLRPYNSQDRAEDNMKHHFNDTNVLWLHCVIQ